MKYQQNTVSKERLEELKDEAMNGPIPRLLREDKSEKVDYSYLVELKPLIDRICNRLTEGEKKYARLNWRECKDPLTYKQSAMRHTMQYMWGERDEDHGIAAVINLLILLDLEQHGVR